MLQSVVQPLVRRVTDKGTRTLIQRAIASLRARGSDAHLWLPGVGTLNGLTTGNYKANTGVLTEVDSTDGAGLVLDALGTVGAELISDPNCDTPAAWTATFTTGTATVSGGNLNISSADGSTTYLSPNGFTPIVGKTYSYTVVVTASSGFGGYLYLGSGDGASSSFTLAKTYTGVLKCTTATCLVSRVSGGASSCTISSISIKEVTGIHATQTTTGAKPYLRRGGYNLLTYSQDLSNAAWVTGGTAVKTSSTLITFNGTGSTNYVQQYTTAVQKASTTYTLSVALSGTGSVKLRLSNGVDQTNGDTTVVLSSTPTRVSTTWTFNATTPISAYMRIFSVDAATVTATDWQFELGSTASDYSPTTATAASNPAAGKFWWSFDGNDYLTLGSVPFQMSDDHCVIVGAMMTSLVSGDVFAQRNTADAAPLVPLIRFDAADSKIKALWRDNSGALQTTPFSSSFAINTPYILSARKVGDAKNIRVNGVAGSGGAIAPIGVATVNNATIGCNTQAVSASFFPGSIYPVLTIKGTVSDAELLMYERLIAALTPGAPRF